MAATAQRGTITAEGAKQAAEQTAREIGGPMCIAVCDESGILKAFSRMRMDGAALLSVTLAQDTALTAVSFGLSTDAWWEFIKKDPPLHQGIVSYPRLIVFGGGYPITLDGGIGVSGGHYTQDMEVAKAGLAALGAQP